MSDKLGHPPSLLAHSQRGEKKAPVAVATNRDNPTFKNRPNPLKIKDFLIETKTPLPLRRTFAPTGQIPCTVISGLSRCPPCFSL